ncbi:MAG: DNA-processing protein DprA [Candidatus Ventricola sp.]
MAQLEQLCARVCLLTRAAWTDDLPAPLTRPMLRSLLDAGALHGLVLRAAPGVSEALLARAARLLSRAKAVCLCLEAYHAQGYDVLLPEDALWPRRLHALGAQMPQFLFVRGNVQLLARQAVAVAGSRRVAGETLAAARRVGQSLAAEGLTLVCGGAQGVDTAVQDGLLQLGGSLVLVPARPASQLLGQQALSLALDEGRLLLVCDALPDDPFSSQRAIVRNHTIYALGGAALVMAAREGVGGSWHGATDCLRGGYTRVFVPRQELDTMPGSRALHARGAAALELSQPLGAQLFARQQMSLFSGDAEEAMACRRG